MRKTSSTIRRVQDLLTARKATRVEPTPGRFTREGRAARLDAESRQHEAFVAGRPVPPLPGGPPGGGT